jgi:hypothetical protein
MRINRQLHNYSLTEVKANFRVLFEHPILVSLTSFEHAAALK